MTDYRRNRPWIKWATLAAVATVFAVVQPMIAAMWNRYQTVDDARKHSASDEVRFAWIMYGQSKTNALILRNRLNDCASRGRTAACRQYEMEYNEEADKMKQLYQSAMSAGKDK